MRTTASAAFVVCLTLVSAGPASGGSGQHGYGLGMSLPTGWSGRIAHRQGLALLEAGNPGATIRVRFALTELGNRPGTNGFRLSRLPIALRADDVVERGDGPSAGHSLLSRRFATSGRSFLLRVNIAARPVPMRLLRGVNAVLATVRIEPPPGSASRARLRRPLRLPELSADEPCPISPRARPAPGVATTLGTGPAYPAIGSRDGVARLTGDRRVGDAYAHKVLWAVRGRYRGPLLFRGGRLDGPGVIRFGGFAEWWPGRWPEERSGWRSGPTTTLVPGAGCFAFLVDGPTFSRTIVFAARP